jgi:hypothetical protein
MSCLKPLAPTVPHGSLRLKRQRPIVISENDLTENTGDSKNLGKVLQRTHSLPDNLPVAIPKACHRQQPALDQACFKEKRRKSSSCPLGYYNFKNKKK